MLVLNPARDDDAGSDLWSAFCGLAESMGDYHALLAPGRDSLTFRDLRDQIAATRNTLNRWGIGRGDRVVVVLPNGPEMAVCFLAITASAIFTPFNPAYTEDEFRRYIARIQPKLLIVPSDSETTARKAAESLGVTTIELVVEENRPAGHFILRGGIESSCADPNWNTINDVALILHTSGTTAQQKLVPLKQRHLLTYARGINRFYRLDSTDRCLTLNPMFHGAGLKGGLLVPLINGSAVVCPPEGLDSFFKYLDVYRPTWYTAGYTIQNAILREAGAHRSIVEASRLRFIRCGAGRLDPKVQRGLETIFRAPVIQQYSASEASGITCNSFPPAVRKPGSAGIPVINEVAIMDFNGSFLPTGEEGEIVVRGPSVFDGYLDDPEANAAAFANGWFRTGDLGRFDADGFLMISGRISDRVLLFEGRGSRAFQELGGHLNKNRLVVIAANGSEGAPLAIPFLGGTLKLALGAPTLAVLHDVPLLPLFAVPDDAGGFDVTIEPPIGSSSNRATSSKASDMTRCYAQLLETYVKRYPTVWRSWFTQNTWSPYPYKLEAGEVR